MKKFIDTVFRVLLTLLLVMPIFGLLGVFPEPTRDMYTTDQAFSFIQLLMAGKYVLPIEGIVFAIAVGCLWTKRIALAALLILPFTVNIIGFHWFLDGGPFTAGAIMGNVLMVLNLYFLWQNRAQYRSLFVPHK